MSKTKKRNRKTNASKKVETKRPIWIALVVIGTVLTAITALLLTRSSDGIPDDFVPQVEGAPKVAVSEERIDYGDVKLNSTVETVFQVSNVGDETLFVLGEPQVELLQGC